MRHYILKNLMLDKSYYFDPIHFFSIKNVLKNTEIVYKKKKMLVTLPQKSQISKTMSYNFSVYFFRFVNAIQKCSTKICFLIVKFY